MFSDEVYTGAFHVTPAAEGNHGPVRVSYTYHMAYEDGKPYYPMRRKTPCFSYGDIRRVHRIYASN